MDWGQPNLHDLADVLSVAGQPRPLAGFGLTVVEIEDRSDTTAYHVPEGVLAIYDPTSPAPSPGRPDVSTLSIAPALLSLFGVTAPSYMRDPGALTELTSAARSA